MIKKISAAVTGLIAIIVAVWGALSYLDVRPVLSRDIKPIEMQVAANTTSIQLQRWQYLNEKLHHGGLTPPERLEYCQLSAKLGFKVPECQ